MSGESQCSSEVRPVTPGDEHEVNIVVTKTESSRPSVTNTSSSRPSLFRQASNVGVGSKMRNYAFKMVTAPLGLSAVQNIEHPNNKNVMELEHPHNSARCCCGVVLWLFFFAYVVIIINEATCDMDDPGCAPVQEVKVLPWDEERGPSVLPSMYVKSRQTKLKFRAQYCEIVQGNYSGYQDHKKLGIIHSQYGGCKEISGVNLTDKVQVLVDNGGCQHFPGDSGDYAWCFLMDETKVIGQFGDPLYAFVKLDLELENKNIVNAGSSGGNETDFSLIWKDPVTKLKEGTRKKSAWTSYYVTANSFSTVDKEIFFKRHDIMRYDGAWSRFGLPEQLQAAEKGKTEVSELRYHHEYTRFSESLPLEMLLAKREGTHTVMSVYLRAMSTMQVTEERPKRTWLQVAEGLGGFFEAAIVAIAFIISLGIGFAFRKGISTTDSGLRSALCMLGVEHCSEAVSP